MLGPLSNIIDKTGPEFAEDQEADPQIFAPRQKL